MSADKRTVSTDALETLGMIHTREEKRDAIHLAVIPVEAGCNLAAGDHVGLVDGKAYKNDKCDRLIGIVDPFLSVFALKGQRFWLVIYPRVITSLRHVWTHPEIPDETGVSAKKSYPPSEQWIRDWAATVPLDYETIMYGADEWVRDQKRNGYGEYLCFGGLLEGKSVPKEFWKHYEIVRGVSVEEGHRGSFFTCSC